MLKREQKLEKNAETTSNYEKQLRGEKPMRIAICDDNHVARERVKEILRKNEELSASKNVDIDEASSGEELLEMHNESRFNIFFLDIEMGDMSGIVAGHKIRSNDNDVHQDSERERDSAQVVCS